jgi:hypothetical protein
MSSLSALSKNRLGLRYLGINLWSTTQKHRYDDHLRAALDLPDFKCSQFPQKAANRRPATPRVSHPRLSESLGATAGVRDTGCPHLHMTSWAAPDSVGGGLSSLLTASSNHSAGPQDLLVDRWHLHWQEGLKTPSIEEIRPPNSQDLESLFPPLSPVTGEPHWLRLGLGHYAAPCGAG